MPSRNSVEACPRPLARLVLVFRARAPSYSACVLMRAEEMKTLLNGC